ncbi:hypothetical protein PENTCL1PPCAC_2372, partial [Pristionchus entomophagus]
LFGREYVLYYFGQKLTYLQQKVDDNSNRLLPFLLFARMFPISPSWLLNIVAPIPQYSPSNLRILCIDWSRSLQFHLCAGWIHSE